MSVCPLLFSLLSPYVRTKERRDLLCCNLNSQKNVINFIPNVSTPHILKNRGHRISFIGDSSMAQIVESMMMLHVIRKKRITIEMNTDFHLDLDSVDRHCLLNSKFRKRNGRSRVKLQIDTNNCQTTDTCNTDSKSLMTNNTRQR